MMLVYVETNFVLEHARQQEQASAVEELFSLAEAGSVKLYFPSYCIAEVFSNLRLGVKKRIELNGALNEQVSQLYRSEANEALAENLTQVATNLLAISRREEDRARQALTRLLALADPLAIDRQVYREAQRVGSTHSLSQADALIFASILAHLRQQSLETTKLFISRDKKAFYTTGLQQELGRFACGYLDHFAHGVSRIRHRGSSN